MIPSFSKSFDDVSTDVGSADNQPIERTYKIIPYDSTSWFYEIPMHAHVFIRPSNTISSRDSDYHTHHPQSGEYHALTPAQLNWVLHEESKKAAAEGKVFYPHDAAREWKYVGINMTPAEDKNDKKHTKQRFITVHMRSAMMMDNHWGDAKGTDYLSFVFKFVVTSNKTSYVVGPSDIRVATNEYKLKGTNTTEPLGKCVQLVAIRSSKRLLSTEALCRVPGDPTVGTDFGGMGIHVPVGIMAYNQYNSSNARDDDLWSKVGVACTDATKASSEHVHALTLAV